MTKNDCQHARIKQLHSKLCIVSDEVSERVRARSIYMCVRRSLFLYKKKLFFAAILHELMYMYIYVFLYDDN